MTRLRFYVTYDKPDIKLNRIVEWSAHAFPKVTYVSIPSFDIVSRPRMTDNDQSTQVITVRPLNLIRIFLISLVYIINYLSHLGEKLVQSVLVHNATGILLT